MPAAAGEPSLDEDDFDAHTQFWLHRFEQYARVTADFGMAGTLARAKRTSTEGSARLAWPRPAVVKVWLLK